MEILFILLSLLSILTLYFGGGKNKRLILFFTAWQIIVGILAINGWLEVFTLLLPVCIFVGIIIFIITYKDTQMAQIKSRYLLSVHIVRIPVELFLYQFFLDGKIPQLMTFNGWNFDILTGISAGFIVLFMLFTRKSVALKLLLIWNYIGLIFLLIIVALAVLSAPLPIQQLAFDQPNIVVFEFPYCFLPTCIVPLVFLSHFLWIKWYYQQKSRIG